MVIHGFQKLTLLDYPGRTACTVFLSGCNFRCPFCHNAPLLTAAGEDGMDFMRRFMPALKDHLTEDGLAVVEIGDGREAFEAIWPDLPVTWLATEEEEDMIFAVHARDLKDL